MKKWMGFVLALAGVLAIAGCNNKSMEERVDKEVQESVTEILGEEENDVESIQNEIARIEQQSREHCDIDSSNMGQQDMNYHSAQWYKLWDDELNSLWSRLSDELDAETKAKVLEEQKIVLMVSKEVIGPFG